jgi:predicted HNH restriction endonuclease
VSDLSVVCANCHAFLHLDSRKPKSVASLRRALMAQRLKA